MYMSAEQQVRWVLYNAETKLQSIPVNHEEIQWTVMRMKQLDWKKYYIWRDGWQNWQQLDIYLHSTQKEIHVEFKKLDTENPTDADTNTETTATVKVDRFSVDETPDKASASQPGMNNVNVASSAHVKGISEPKRSSKPADKPKTNNNIFDASRPATKNTTFVDWDDQLAQLFVESAQDYKGDSVATNSTNDPDRNSISFKEEKLARANYQNRAERHTLKIEVLFINSKGKTFKSFSKNISLSGTLIDDDIPAMFLEPKIEIIIINRFAKTTQNSRLQLFAKCPILSAPNRIQFVDVKDQQKTKLKSLLEQYLVDQKQIMSKAS